MRSGVRYAVRLSTPPLRCILRRHVLQQLRSWKFGQSKLLSKLRLPAFQSGPPPVRPKATRMPRMWKDRRSIRLGFRAGQETLQSESLGRNCRVCCRLSNRNPCDRSGSPTVTRKEDVPKSPATSTYPLWCMQPQASGLHISPVVESGIPAGIHGVPDSRRPEESDVAAEACLR